jgi:hypothetical protein
MSPILQTLANGSAYGYRTLAAAAAGSYESIATTTLGSSAASITFSSIPSTYQHLQIRFMSTPTGTTASDEVLYMTFNSVAGTSYTYHEIWGNGASVTANGVDSLPYTRFIGQSDLTVGSDDAFCVGVIDIHDYKSTSKNKTVRVFSGYDNNGGGRVNLSSGLFNNTGAISTIKIERSGSTNMAAGSVFSLYGIKGA